MYKILLFTKIYDAEQQTLSEIEASVQADLDSYLGKAGKVKVSISAVGNTIFYRILRHYNYSGQSTYPDSLRIEDCQLFTGHGCLDFRLPVGWGATPFLNAMPMIVWKDPKDIYTAYKESCKKLGASLPTKISAKTSEQYLEVAITYKNFKTKPEVPQDAPEDKE